MESEPEEEIASIDTQDRSEGKNRVNWIYLTIVACPLLLFTLVLSILSLTTSVNFLGEWQIWTFLIAVPVLGFIAGFFLRKPQLNRTLFFICLFLISYTAIILSGLSGGLEITQGGTVLQILIGFLGGLLYGGGFGIVYCVLLVLASYASFGIMRLILKNRSH